MQTYFKIFKLNCVISNNISCCNKQSRFIQLGRRHSILSWLQSELNKFEDVRPQKQTCFEIYQFNCVIGNILWFFYLRYVSDKIRNKTKAKQDSNIISEHRSICKKNSVTNRDGQFYFIYFCNLQLNIQATETSSHKLYGYFSNDKTNSRLKLDRLFWQYGVNINVRRFLLIIGKLVEIVLSVTNNIGLKCIS